MSSTRHLLIRFYLVFLAFVVASLSVNAQESINMDQNDANLSFSEEEDLPEFNSASGCDSCRHIWSACHGRCVNQPGPSAGCLASCESSYQSCLTCCRGREANE